MSTSNVEHVTYFGFHYALMRFLGLGWFHDSRKNNFENFSSKAYLIYGFISVFSVFVYTGFVIYYAYDIWKKDLDGNMLFFSLNTSGVYVFSLPKLLLIVKNNKKIQAIVRGLEVESERFRGDKKIYKTSDLLSKIATWGFSLGAVFTVLSMCIYFIMIDLKRKITIRESNYTATMPRKAPFAIYVLWDVQEDGPYIAAFVCIMIGVTWSSLHLVTLETFVASLLTHIAGQFQMIRIRLEKVGDETVEKLIRKLENNQTNGGFKYKSIPKLMDWDDRGVGDYSTKKKWLLMYFTKEEYSTTMIRCMKEIVHYHRFVIKLTNDLEKSYRNGFMFQILSSYFLIGLLLVQTTQESNNLFSVRTIVNLAFLICILWQLFIQTYSANEITLQASRIASAAFGTPWYDVETENRKICELVFFLIQRSQRPVFVSAGYIGPMSNGLFVSIIKISYQIFTLISSAMSARKSQ